MSLDALRGFDTFWIIGADALGRGLRSMSDTGFTGILATQLEHAEWEGFRFYDLIFLTAFFDDHVTKGFGDMMISIAGLLLAFWFVRLLYNVV